MCLSVHPTGWNEFRTALLGPCVCSDSTLHGHVIPVTQFSTLTVALVFTLARLALPLGLTQPYS